MYTGTGSSTVTLANSDHTLFFIIIFGSHIGRISDVIPEEITSAFCDCPSRLVECLCVSKEYLVKDKYIDISYLHDASMLD